LLGCDAWKMDALFQRPLGPISIILNFPKFWKMALFYPCMKIKKILGQMYSFDVVNNSPLWFFFIKCLWLRPCAYLCG
jgi:hypothetical protein